VAGQVSCNSIVPQNLAHTSIRQQSRRHLLQSSHPDHWLYRCLDGKSILRAGGKRRRFQLRVMHGETRCVEAEG